MLRLTNSVTYQGYTFSIEQLVDLKLMTPDGRHFDHYRAQTLVHALAVARGEADPATAPGRPRL